MYLHVFLRLALTLIQAHKMKFKLPKALFTSLLLSMCSVAVAETYEKGSIEQVSNYTERLTSPDATYKYGSIKSPNVYLTAVRQNKTCNIEVGSIDAGEGDVQVTTYIGNIALGDVKADYIQVSTQSGDIKLTGEINATNPGSTIDIALQDENASGNIILDGASISGVAMGIHYHALDGIESSGQILISGETTLADVHLSSGLVNVKEGAKLTLENVSFTNRTSTDANAGLVLSDNVTLTLSGEQPLEIGSLTVGESVSFVVELSDEVFENLDNTAINLFSIVGEEENDIDLTGVKFTFTNAGGTEAKSGTITAGSGGSITVTNIYTVAIPEPTTATLSLLALAGMAMRRRRK